MNKLTDEQIEDIADANGHASVVSYGKPAKREVVWYDEDLTQFARAIETAATEPLLQRTAELERKSDQDDETILWQAKEISDKIDRIAELERQLEEARSGNS